MSGTFEAIALEKDVKKWNDPKGSFRAYQTQADVFLALAQGQIEATVVTSTVAAATVKSGKFNWRSPARCAVRHRLRRADRAAASMVSSTTSTCS